MLDGVLAASIRAVIYSEKYTRLTGLLWSLLVGGIIAISLHAVFAIGRVYIPAIFAFRRQVIKTYDLRDWNGEPLHHRPDPSLSPWGWITASLDITDQTFVDNYTLDAAIFVRFLRAMMYFFVTASLISGLILLPIYATGPNKDLPESDSRSVSVVGTLSILNLEPNSSRFYATWVVDTILVVVMLMFVANEYRVFTKLRLEYRRKRIPPNYSIVAFDVPRESRSNEKVLDAFDHIYPGDVLEACVVFGMEPVARKQRQWLRARDRLAQMEWRLKNKPNGGRPTFRPWSWRKLVCMQESVDAIEYYSERTSRLREEILEMQSSDEKRPSRSAFLRFRTQRAASTAVQTLIGTHDLQWHTAFAPDPKAVNWRRLGMHRTFAVLMKMNSILWLAFFMTWWAAVVTLVMGLANIQQLSAKYPGLQWITELPHSVLSLIEAYLPILIILLLNLVPELALRFCVRQERIHSLGHVEAKARDFVFLVQAVGTYFVVVTGGSFFSSFSAFYELENLNDIPMLLAQGAPKQALFFQNFILSSTLIAQTIDFSEIIRMCAMGILRLLFCPNGSKLGRRAADFCRSSFQYIRYYAQASVVVLIAVSYSTISPLTCVCAAFYFGCTLLYTKYHLAYTKLNDFDGGGSMFKGAFHQVFFALYAKTVTMMYLLVLNQALVPAILQVIPLAVTIGVHVALCATYRRVSEFGTFHSFKSETEDCPEEYAKLYQQPELQPPPNENDTVELERRREESVVVLESVSHIPDFFAVWA